MHLHLLRTLFCGLFVLVLFGSCDRSHRDSSKAVIKIGAIASLTGAAAPNGESWVAGARLAAEELNARGVPVQLVVEDDQTNPSGAARAFQSLAQMKRVSAVIGGTWDYLLKAIEPLAKQANMPLITPTNPVELLDTSSETLTTFLSLAAERQAVKHFLIVKGIKRLAIVYSAIPWGQAHADFMTSLAKELGIEVVLSERFPMDTYQDVVRTVGLRLKEKSPDLVLVIFESQGLAQFLQELDRIAFSASVLSPMYLDEAAALLKHRSELLVNAYGIFPKIHNPDFAKRFESRYQKPPRVYAAEGYDAVSIAVEVLRRGQRIGREGSPIEIDGVTGKLSLPAPQGAVASSLGVVRGVKDGTLYDVE